MCALGRKNPHVFWVMRGINLKHTSKTEKKHSGLMHQELLESFTFCVYKCSQLNIIIFITQLAFVAIFRIVRLTCNLITTRAAGIKLRSKPDKTIGFINWRMQVQIKDTARHRYTARIWNNKLSNMKIQTRCYHKLSWLKCYSVYIYLALYDQTSNIALKYVHIVWNR